ncbi:MAG: hypothetical protein IPJ06_00655 [Saprospiraceae bacterium]|nr:hypothetical protein [Saprospiraceae bacterium]
MIDDLLNSENFTNKKRTPLERLLYSIIWKQGDLKKIHHIINGIRSNASEYSDCQGIVFQQFGSHLSNSQEEPIIDQHVIRAFGVAHVDLDEIQGLLKMSTFRKKDLPLIHQYSNWLRNLNVYIKESNKQSVIRWIDKILFSLGKDIKVS